MSKLYDEYLYLKQNTNSNNDLFLFKAGAFFIFLDKDAIIVSDILSLKLTNLNSDVVKCGFPISSLDKNVNILKHCNYNVKIIENDTFFNINEYKINDNYNKMLDLLSNVDTNNLSIKDAYDLIYRLKKISNISLNGGVNTDD